MSSVVETSLILALEQPEIDSFVSHSLAATLAAQPSMSLSLSLHSSAPLGMTTVTLQNFLNPKRGVDAS